MGDMSTWALMNVRRNAQIGIDFGFWIKDCVNPDTGVIDWGRRPLYTPIWGKEYLASVRVINGDTASPPKGVFITYEYKLDNPFCAEGAGWVLDTARYPCKDWFSVQHGPNKYRIDKKGNMLIDLCTGAAAEITARQQQVMALTNGPSLVSLDTREKRRREEALQKARKRLATKSSESIRMLSYDKKDGCELDGAARAGFQRAPSLGLLRAVALALRWCTARSLTSSIVSSAGLPSRAARVTA
eukprot:8322471-Pyramimonas_sp.AAC.1